LKKFVKVENAKVENVKVENVKVGSAGTTGQLPGQKGGGSMLHFFTMSRDRELFLQ
jgi:hypothetical protein